MGFQVCQGMAKVALPGLIRCAGILIPKDLCSLGAPFVVGGFWVGRGVGSYFLITKDRWKFESMEDFD